MINDITFCTAPCLNDECERNTYIVFTNKGYLGSQMDLSFDCSNYEPDYDYSYEDESLGVK